ncbi:MAG: efflux RND transporter permease subunit [Elusimicrobia bacterium]|nr:efflux RND transporter permease subunit [Elusimicrobiota bacterium]
MPTADKLARSFVSLVVSRPRTVLLVFLVCAAALGWHARRFKIDAGADTLLTKDNRHYVQTNVVDRRFAAQEFLVVAYKPRTWAVLSERTFEDLAGLKGKLLRLERVESVRTLLDVPLPPRSGALSAGADLSDWTMERRRLSLKELEERLRGHPVYEDLLINKDRSATALQVLFKKDAELDVIDGRITDLQLRSLTRGLTRDERRDLARLKRRAEPIDRRLDKIRAAELESIRAMMADYEDDADIYLGGIHVLAHQLIRIITNDLIVFGTAIGLMICLVLFLLFRRLRWVVIPAVCCVCSVLSTVGLFGLLGLKATVISSSFIALQLILTLGISIHLIVQYREYAGKRPDWDQERLVRETLSRKAIPCFYAGFTNIVGFASLLFSRLQPVIDFGWMMSIAMLFSIVSSLILFPAMMAMFAKEPPPKPPTVARGLIDLSSRLARRQSAPVAVCSALALAAGAGGLFLLDVENSFIDYFRDTTRVHEELSFIDRELGGTTPMDITYAIPADERRKDLVLSAGSVLAMQRIQEALRRHEAVGKTLSVVNFARLAKELNGGKPLTEYELTAAYLTMEKDLRSDLLGSFFSPGDSQLRLSIRVKDTTAGLDRARLLADIRSDIEKLGIPADRYRLTGLFVLYQDLLDRLFASQIQTLGVSFAVLTLAILLIFRSLKLALICVAPNILSTVIVLGLMGWLGIPLDFMTIMIASIAMGITVDDTIHYIDRYLEELKGGSGEKAIERTHSSVGYALLYTSLIVILGFTLLGFSDFIPSVLFGLLTALAMALAVLFDLTLLPALLDRFVKC